MPLCMPLLGSYWLSVFHVFNSNLPYNDVIMSLVASQITSLTIVYSTVYSGADQRKHQSSTSLAFVWGIHRWPVNSPHKRPVARKMLPFDNVIMCTSFNDRVLVYSIYRYPIFKWVAMTWQGWKGTRTVNLVMSTRWHTPWLCTI